MRNNRFLRGLKFVAIAAVAITVAGAGITYLWNWLVPPVFGWHTINFGQALGLFLLTRILFGSFRGRGGSRMMGRWERMTPEQREQFRQGIGRGGRCGPFDAPAAPGATT